MSKEKLVPKLRFEEFNQNKKWKEIQLGEAATFINGRAYSQEELLDNGKYKVLRVGNFYTNDSWYYSNFELNNKYYAEYGDLLYTWSASFGPHIWKGEKVIYHYHIWKIELNRKLDKMFLLQLLEEDKKQILSNVTGSTMVHITKSGMEEKNVIIPNDVHEQRKIGGFFKNIDEMIQLQQSKVNKVKDIKSAYLSEMFPKEGEKYPKKRFEGFTEPWRESSLGEIGNLYQPRTISRTSLLSSGIPVFGANGYIGYYSKANHEKDQITISARGENAGNPSYVSGPVWITGNSMVVNIDENMNVNKKYLYSYLSGQNLEKYITGGAQPQLTRDVLNKVPIQIPSLSEQQEIGQFFKNIDKQISVEEEKLDKLEKLKQAYLNDMFV